MSLLSYVSNEALAVINKPISGTTTTAYIYAPGINIANAGDTLVIMSRANGTQTEITLTRSIAHDSTSILFSSLDFGQTIPVGSIITYRSDKKWEKLYTSYQYQSFTGSISAGTSQNWISGGQYGVTFHTWNRDSGDTGVTVGSSTITIAKQYQHAGIRVPYDCTLIGFSGAGRNNNGNRQFAGGLFVGTPDWGATGSITPTLRAYAAADFSPGTAYTNRPVKVEDLTRSFEISAGDVIYPAIKSLDNTNDTIQLTFNLVLKTIKA